MVERILMVKGYVELTMVHRRWHIYNTYINIMCMYQYTFIVRNGACELKNKIIWCTVNRVAKIGVSDEL